MVLPGVAGVAWGTGTTMTGAGVAVEATLFCGVWSTAGIALITELLTCWALVLPASVYPEAIPITAVAERPVTRIFAAVAGFFVVRRVDGDLVGMAFSAVLSVMGVDGGEGGRSGSFSISRHPHLRGRRHDLHHDVRPLRGHHHRHGVALLDLVLQMVA